MQRSRLWLADLMVSVLTPVLIMAMVGSLVFFLIEVFYVGAYAGRLYWVTTCFVVAAVLIARISMTEGRAYASLFMIGLAVAMFLALRRFAPLAFPLDVGLIALIWWCADKLTWDCTFVDTSKDPSAEGLLHTIGLDRSRSERGGGPRCAAPGPAAAAGSDSSQSERATHPPPAQQGIVWRVLRDPTLLVRAAVAAVWGLFGGTRRRPNRPGLWVFYFSLAALPLFGVGQWNVPAGDTETRRRLFLLLCVYLSSGFGLLLCTSFLGLRHYLSKRQAEMSDSMAVVWLAAGSLKIGLLMIVLAVVASVVWLVPRQSAEELITQWAMKLESPPQKASPHGVGSTGPEDSSKPARGRIAAEKQSRGKSAGKQSPQPSSSRPGGQAPPKSGSPPSRQATGGGASERSGEGGASRSAPSSKAQSPSAPAKQSTATSATQSQESGSGAGGRPTQSQSHGGSSAQPRESSTAGASDATKSESPWNQSTTSEPNKQSGPSSSHSQAPSRSPSSGTGSPNRSDRTQGSGSQQSTDAPSDSATPPKSEPNQSRGDDAGSGRPSDQKGAQSQQQHTSQTQQRPAGQPQRSASQSGRQEAARQSGGAAEPDQAASSEQQHPEQPKTAEGEPPAQAPPPEPRESSPSQWFNPSEWLASASALARWVFYAVIAIVFVVFIWLFRHEFLRTWESLCSGWQRLWQWLFGTGASAEEQSPESVPVEKPLPRFDEFTDPFAAGLAGRWSVEQLVRHTFEAFEAWSREQGCARLPDQTPHELAAAVARRVPSIGRGARMLADLYCQVAFAKGMVDARRVRKLEELWQQLRQCRAASRRLAAAGRDGDG